MFINGAMFTSYVGLSEGNGHTNVEDDMHITRYYKIIRHNLVAIHIEYNDLPIVISTGLNRQYNQLQSIGL